MIEKKVLFKTLEDVKKFVEIANTKLYDMELLSGKYVVNAKSIMGVFSLDLTRPLTMIANTDNDPDLEQQFAPFFKVEAASQSI